MAGEAEVEPIVVFFFREFFMIMMIDDDDDDDDESQWSIHDSIWLVNCSPFGGHRA